MDEKCKTCRFWTQMASDNSVGACRRFPPQVVYHTWIDHTDKLAGEERYSLPFTGADEWCGEFKPNLSNKA